MKKKRSMYLLLGVLVLLVIVYFALQAFNKNQQEKEAKKTESEKIQITDIDKNDIAGLSYTDGSSTMNFIKDDGTWKVKDNGDFPLSQSQVEAMVTSAGQLTAVRKLSDADNISDYGLDQPQYTVTLKDSDGKETKLLIGDTTGEDYYVMAEGKDTVYTIGSSLVQGLVFSLDDLLQKETFPTVSTSEIQKVVITHNGTETVYQSKNAGDEDALSTIGGGLGAVSFSKCVDYSLTEDKLSQYGLDEASRTKVEVTYKDSDKKKQTITFYVGGTVTENGTEYNYVQMDGSKMVNLTAGSTIKNVLNQKTDEAVSEN